jgi:cytochrome c556
MGVLTMRMWKGLVATSLMAAMVAIIGGTTTNADEKEKAKFASIGACMKCQNQERNKIGKLAKDGKWDDASTSAKKWHGAAEALAGIKPKKGEEKSWKDLTGKYTDTVKAIVDACDKKDAEVVGKKLGEFSNSCKSCHDAHK